MAIEIERKFLVTGAAWRQGARPQEIRQGYLAGGAYCVVRVRTMGDKGYLTVKGSDRGMSRAEFEYEIPRPDAVAMLAGMSQKPPIEKTRHVLEFGGKTWEVDEFHGANAGLIVAEIELGAEDEAFARPAWVGKEVTDDRRYANASLAETPFSTWPRP